MKVFFRKLHRWLGLLMVLQICAWMFSGFYFALFPIETIRGEHLAAEPEPWTSQDLQEMVNVSTAWSSLEDSAGAGKFSEVRLVKKNGVAWYRFVYQNGDRRTARLVNGQTGVPAERLDAEQALQAAVDGLAVDAKEPSVELVERHESGSEFRGRRLPMWRVSFQSPENLNVYVDAWTGETVARRTDKWRLFDFLWMLHIMDFDERDDFNTPLLQISALLGLILALSGLVYWALTTRVFRRRRPLANHPSP